MAKYNRSACQNERVVGGCPNGSASVIDTMLSGGIQGVCPTLQMELKGAHRRQSKSRTVERIACDCLIEQVKGLADPLLRHRGQSRQSTQIEIVGGEIVRRATRGATGLGGLQSRLNHPCDTNCDLILKLEHVLQRAVEAVGPEMRASYGINQLT